MPWTPSEKWSQEKKDAHDKNADRMNKAWGEKNERERRERVANALGFEKEKSKVNSEASTSKSQSSSSKSDEQTRMEIYSGGRQKPWIYSSDTIKNMLLEKNWRVDKQKINSTDLHNQPSTSGYKPSSPKM